MDFKDNFSRQADRYSRYRPTYPDELFTWLASLVSRHDCAWDCGTGNGQAAVALAMHFETIFALFLETGGSVFHRTGSFGG